MRLFNNITKICFNISPLCTKVSQSILWKIYSKTNESDLLRRDVKEIRTGTLELDKTKGNYYSIIDKFVHELYEYDQIKISYDIGMAKSVDTIRYSKTVVPIAITRAHVQPNSTFEAAGWGRTKVLYFKCLSSSSNS